MIFLERGRVLEQSSLKISSVITSVMRVQQSVKSERKAKRTYYIHVDRVRECVFSNCTECEDMVVFQDDHAFYLFH